ncbi:9697_t:CDS:2 [Racocetra persica]|uniref:9697_t:CDS:1 n=1 Tax=Racocetra persica TaxID=160502 RepID=A0ACA9NLD0_9GLOM|nr:9697_t:CDS:2 [Racocetra persica]
MPLYLRKQLKNHFVLDFVLFGDKFDDIIKSIVDEINILEQVASLGVITADLPQDNNLADMKQHSGILEYRSCLVPKEQLSNLRKALQEIINNYCTNWEG